MVILAAQERKERSGAIYTRRIPRYYLQDFSLHLRPAFLALPTGRFCARRAL